MRPTVADRQLPSARRGPATRVLGVLIMALSFGLVGLAKDGEIRLRLEGTNALIRVEGSPRDDWLIQASDDLRAWTNVSGLGPLLSARTDGPERSVLRGAEEGRFYRAVQTAGLFDTALLRTISLTFTQANWPTRLSNGRNTGSNTLGDLILDNGASIAGVGVRYKGNTSFQIGGNKKSLNIELDYADKGVDLMGYTTINLNNAAGDETIMREPVYFTVLQQYTVGPKGALAKLYINGQYWGVYSLAQQEDGDLINEWFLSNDGDRWRAPNVGGGVPGAGGGGGGGGGFASALSAFSWQGTNVNTYKRYYELKKQNTTNAWQNLVHAIDVLNNTPLEQLREKVEDVLAVDRWLWFLAIENIFADDDSYWNKGADYSFYYEPESGRIHPIEHDGNEAFVTMDAQLSPVQGATGNNRPVLARFLAVPELRQRYLAHMRTVLQESYHPAVLTPFINRLHALSVQDIAADPKKNFSMAGYTNDLATLRTFVTNRYRFLTNHAELRPLAPSILAVSEPASPAPNAPVAITAEVQGAAGAGIDSAWLYYRTAPAGKFSRSQMWDDGLHQDGVPGDGRFGAEVPGFPAGSLVRYYVEARSDNTAQAASFAPARAEEETYSYRIATAPGVAAPVVLNELMADNHRTLADPQGQYDDWIELRNVTALEVDLSGYYLTDDPKNLRKWRVPDGTRIAPNGYLLVWADENGQDTPGLHANFKLAADGEIILLVDTDANNNALVDSIAFGTQTEDRSYGRSTQAGGAWTLLTPTPAGPNP
ncbi:MAG: CotH kinase family protein [Verrucomicrobiota bacterium]